MFLPRYGEDIKGHVLEVGDNRYTRRFGGEKVTKSDVLNIKPGAPETTIVADLTYADQIPSNNFDCAILTFTLQFVYDVKAVFHILHRIMKPGGVVLVVVPGISQIARFDDDNWRDYWRFTSRSMRKLLEEHFRPASLTVEAYGNVLSSLASLHGLISSELTRGELEHHDKRLRTRYYGARCKVAGLVQICCGTILGLALRLFTHNGFFIRGLGRLGQSRRTRTGHSGHRG